MNWNIENKPALYLLDVMEKVLDDLSDLSDALIHSKDERWQEEGNRIGEFLIEIGYAAIKTNLRDAPREDFD